MLLQRLGIAIGCVVVFAGVFASSFLLLQTRSNTATQEGETSPLARVDPKLPAAPSADLPAQPPPDNRKPIPNNTNRHSNNSPATDGDDIPEPQDDPAKPLTCKEATRLGDGCIGRRVTWRGKWTHSQNATVGQQKGSEHVFNTPGPKGEFSFDYPFVVEEPTPLPAVVKGQNVRTPVDQKWGPTRVVTVTGTISRVVTLTVGGEGFHFKVPVLTDVTINR
jgi:hypothetical protein